MLIFDTHAIQAIMAISARWNNLRFILCSNEVCTFCVLAWIYKFLPLQSWSALTGKKIAFVSGRRKSDRRKQSVKVKVRPYMPFCLLASFLLSLRVASSSWINWKGQNVMWHLHFRLRFGFSFVAFFTSVKGHTNKIKRKPKWWWSYACTLDSPG